MSENKMRTAAVSTKQAQQPKVIPKSFNIKNFFTPNASFGPEALKAIVIKADAKSISTAITVGSEESPIGVMDLISDTKSVRFEEVTPSQDMPVVSSNHSVEPTTSLTQPIAMSQKFEDVATPLGQQPEIKPISDQAYPSEQAETPIVEKVADIAISNIPESAKSAKKPRSRAKKTDSKVVTPADGEDMPIDSTPGTDKKEVKKRSRKPAAPKTPVATVTETTTDITATAALDATQTDDQEIDQAGEINDATEIFPSADGSGDDDSSRPKRVRKAPVYYEPTEAVSTGVFEEIPEDGEDDVIYVDKTDGDADIKDETKKPSEIGKKRKSESAPSPVDVLSLLTPEALIKVNNCKDRMLELARELAELEKLPDLSDENLDVDTAYTDLVSFVMTTPTVMTAVPTTSATAVSSTTTTEEDESKTIIISSQSQEDGVDSVAKESDCTVPTTTPIVPVTVLPVVVLTPEDYVTIIIARSVQGSILPISDLTAHAKQTLVVATETLLSLSKPTAPTAESPATTETETVADAEGVNTTMQVDIESNNELSDDAKIRLEQLQTELNKFINSDDILSEKIKCIAERESYKAKAKGPTYSEVDEVSAWRWDVKSLSYFAKHSHVILREAKSNRGRYRRAIKALSKVYEQIIKANDDSKLISLEEAVSVARLEITKAKERRRETERKRLEEMEKKRQKEEEREANRKKKEEIAAIKAAEDREKRAIAEREKAEREKEKLEKEKIVPEKILKEREAMEKQKNSFSSFFKKPSTTSASTSYPTDALKTTSVISLDENGTILQEEQIPMSQATCSHSQSTPAKGDVAGVAHANPRIPLVAAQRIVAPYPWQRVTIDRETFEKTAFSNMSIDEIIHANSQRVCYSSDDRVARKPLNISVTLSNQNAFGGNAYDEVVQRSVDSRMRTLFFHTDYRPAYTGTFSKKSLDISGRRPLEKDTYHLNYEFDSEEEWEEEEEGEDIANSEDNSDDEGDELEYDEFLVQDNDFGSDVGSDGDEVARVAMRIREGEERLGTRYISSTSSFLEDNDCGVYVYDGHVTRSARLGGGQLTMAGASDVDTQRLSSYGTVVYGSMVEHIRTLGDTTTDPKDGEKADATDKNKNAFDTATVRELAVFIQGKKDGVEKLVISFQADHPLVSKAETKRRIIELAERKKHADGYGTTRWVCREDKLAVLAAEGALTTGSSSQSSSAASSTDWLSSVPTIEFTPRKEKVKAVAKVAEAVPASADGTVPVTAAKPKSGAKSASKSTSKTSTKEAVKEVIKVKAPKPTHNRRTRAAVDGNATSEPVTTTTTATTDDGVIVEPDADDMEIGPFGDCDIGNGSEDLFSDQMLTGGDLSFSPLFDANAASSPASGSITAVPIASTTTTVAAVSSEVQPISLSMCVEQDEGKEVGEAFNDNNNMVTDENECPFSNQGSFSSQDLQMLADI